MRYTHRNKSHVRKGHEAKQQRRERALARRRIECQYLIAGIFPAAMCPYNTTHKLTPNDLQAKIDRARYDIAKLSTS